MPSPLTIYDELKKEGLTLSNQYNYMSMFCFISLTIPIRSYTTQILACNELTDDSTTSKNITEELLNEFYENFELHSNNILKDKTLTLEQNSLLNKSMSIIKGILKSNILGIEANYAYLVQHILMGEDFSKLIRSHQGNEQQKRDVIDEIEQNLSFKLDKYSLYGSARHTLQSQFHHAVIKYLGLFIANKIDDSKSNAILFCQNSHIFSQRLADSNLDANEVLPTHADFTNNWLLISADIEDIYLSYSRCEYTAKVLAEFSTDDWLSEPAQLAWSKALQPKLFSEMRFQDLAPLLLKVTSILLDAWNKRLAHGPIDIIIGRSVNRLFIDDVTAAMKEACHDFKNLLFCQVYSIEEGRWFTFLNNDFIFEAPNRTRRHAPDGYKLYPLPIALRPDESLPTQPQVKDLIADFSGNIPFHQRLYKLSAGKVKTSVSNITQQGMEMVNQIINPQGQIIDYQVKILQHHADESVFLDNRAILQTLAEIITLHYPESPRLYDYVFKHLQNSFFNEPMALVELSKDGFIKGQSIDIYTVYLSSMGTIPFEHQQAILRFIDATLHTLLGFTSYLSTVDPVLAAAPVSAITSQWLCFGAIISEQLGLAESSTESLLHLGFSTLFDTGLFPVRLLAHQQLALLSPTHSFADISQAPQLALKTVATNIAALSTLQNMMLSCLVADRRLVEYINQWQYSLVRIDIAPLSVLIENSLQEQQRLLDAVFKQLAPNQQARYLSALRANQLKISWYSADDRIVGVALLINEQQQGIILPLGQPESVPLAFRQFSKASTQEALLSLCFGGFETTAKEVQVSVTVSLDNIIPANIAFGLKQFLSLESASLLTLTGETYSEARFNLLKQGIISWSAQHLLFVAHGDSPEIQGLPELTQRIAEIASHPDVINWSHASQHGAATPQTTIDFSRAIANVMLTKTHWPDIAARLREIPIKNGATALQSLPSEGFSGFWWDPVSHFCYLGWQHDGQRLLFASLAEDRESFYALPENGPYEAIWRSLGTFNNLAADLQALRQGIMTVDEFFTGSLPLAWRMECFKESSFTLPEGSLPHPALSGVYYYGEPSRRVYFYCPTTLALTNPQPHTKKCVPIQLAFLADGAYRIDFDIKDERLSADLHFTLQTGLPSLNSTALTFSRDWQFTPTATWRLISASKSQRLLKQGVIHFENFIEWDNKSPITAEMQPLPRLLEDVMGNIVYVFAENNYQQLSYRIPDVEGNLQPSPYVPVEWPRITPNSAPHGQSSALEYFDHFFSDQARANTTVPLDNDRRVYVESLLKRFRIARQERLNNIQKSISSSSEIPFHFTQNLSTQIELQHFEHQLRNRDIRLEVEMQKGLNVKLHLTNETWFIFHWRKIDLYNPQLRKDAHLEAFYQQKIFKKLQQLLLAEPHDESVYGQLIVWITKSLAILEQIITMLDSLNPYAIHHLPTSNYVKDLQSYRAGVNEFFSFYNEQPHITTELFNQPWTFKVEERGAERRQPLWQPVINWLKNVTQAASQVLHPLEVFTGLTNESVQSEHLNSRVNTWQRTWNNTLVAWSSINVSQEILLIRPDVSEQGFPISGVLHNWPVKCILSASRQPVIQPDQTALASFSRLDPQQIESLVLTASGPSPEGIIDIPLATEPNKMLTIGFFAQLAAQRLSCAFALAELADAAFLWRLQQRMREVMKRENRGWNIQETTFYASEQVTTFLNETRLESIDKRKYAQLFGVLYENKSLVIRLILSDPQMLFGMLCFYQLQQQPAKATANVAKAWFLFQHTFSENEGEQPKGQILLAGI
ncbi:hypothetical protein SC206_00895 [Rouxiella sp. T17]|uniref:hypothetical protein n=1 Tax=Rouxiella sp. T17 TaxID=3085684 RepID=UPI002FC59C56